MIITEVKIVWKIFCEKLKEHVTKAMNCERKKKSYYEQKVCYICKKNLVLMIKNTIK